MRVGGVVPSGGQRVAEVLKPAQLGQAWAAVAVLGLADERDRRVGGPRAAAAGERQDVDLMAGLVLAAGDDSLPDRADGEAASPKAYRAAHSPASASKRDLACIASSRGSMSATSHRSGWARRLGMRQEGRLVRNEFFKGEWSTELDFAMLADEWYARQKE
jgi:hypothetical protein